MKKIAVFILVVIVLFVWTVPVITANGGFRIIYGQTIDFLNNIGKPAVWLVQSFVDEVGNIETPSIEFIDPLVDGDFKIPKLYGGELLSFLTPTVSMLPWANGLSYSKVLHVSGQSYLTEMIGRYLFDVVNAGNGEYDLYIGTSGNYGAIMLYRRYGNSSVEDRVANRYLIRYRIDQTGYDRYVTRFYRPQGTYGVCDPGKFWISEDMFYFEVRMVVNVVRVYSNGDALRPPL